MLEFELIARTHQAMYLFVLFYTLLDSVLFNCADCTHYDVFNHF